MSAAIDGCPFIQLCLVTGQFEVLLDTAAVGSSSPKVYRTYQCCASAARVEPIQIMDGVPQIWHFIHVELPKFMLDLKIEGRCSTDS